MNPTLHIALRFISHRKRSMLISFAGITLGVAFFICTQAQTQGFERFYIKTVLGSTGALTVEDKFQPRFTGVLQARGYDIVGVANEQGRKYIAGIDNADQVIRVIREFSNVAACTPVLEGSVTLRTNFREEVFRVQGIDLEAHLQTTALGEQIVAGDLAAFRAHPQGLLLGAELAKKLQTRVGDTVTLAGPDATPRAFFVSGIFQTGDNLIDERRGFIHLPAARRVLNKPAGLTLIMVKLIDPDRAPQLAAHLETLLQHRVRSWQDRERGNLQVFHAIRISAAITVSAIIVLAGFGIFNVLTLMILDKTREIAILRSMGYERGDIRDIFLWQGLLIAAVGGAAGCVFGMVLTWWISRVPVRIRGFFAADHFLVSWSWTHYVAALAVAFTAVLLASYWPARRAARLAPVDVLRGSGQ